FWPWPFALDSNQFGMLGMTLFALSFWLTDVIPPGLTGAAVIAGISLRGFIPFEEAASHLGHPMIWLLLGALLYSAALARSGLPRRIASFVLSQAGGSPSRTLFSMLG